MSSIPSPIIFDILIQLPVKSLARFKSLNKLYCSFITDPHFIYTQFNNGTGSADDNNRLILSYIEHRNLDTVIHFLTVREIDELAVVEYSAAISFGSYHVLPSSYGLVCFFGLHGDVYVCNPTIKQIARLPDIDAEGFLSLSCGFGFDEISGKHKVIKFLEPVGASVDDLGIGIISMGDNRWRSIRYHPRFRFPNHEPPVFSGGFFYWITWEVNPGGQPCSSSIASFDIEKETLEAISPPESVAEKNGYNLYLAELGGELCLVDVERKRMDIWIFKGNHAESEENWVRGASIVHESETVDAARPVAFNGVEILLHGFIRGLGQLNCYNVQTGCFRELEIKGIASQFFHVNHYAESLFPVEL
ncbi:hypothetical protein V6N13_103407 [Hibiscus sabdariffa]|uniref:F-box domain-containing protein n=1 Tax=Hibiscus sabdariffa TaxID=183260 RepID=A0ABR2BHX7_9ROSI